MLRIGAALLMQMFLINVLYLVQVYFPFEGLTVKAYNIFNSLLGSLIYLFSFLFPSVFFHLIGKKKHNESVWCNVRLSYSYPFMLFGGLAIILFFAYNKEGEAYINK